MAAHNTEFPWLSYYGHYNFFEQKMREHSKVIALEKIGVGHYRLTRADGRDLVVFVCECYAFGAAEYDEVVEKLGQLDAVVISSNWCGYALEFKLDCMIREVGIFTIGEFMAALNLNEFWTYLSPQQQIELER